MKPFVGILTELKGLTGWEITILVLMVSVAGLIHWGIYRLQVLARKNQNESN